MHDPIPDAATGAAPEALPGPARRRELPVHRPPRPLRIWSLALTLGALSAAPATGQASSDPYPDPIPPEEGVIVLPVHDFVRLPEVEGEPARAMHLVVEPGTDRIFVVGMRGPLWATDPTGREVVEYLNVNDPQWGVSVESGGRERGIQSFAFHPQFAAEGTPGYGRFYIWTDTDRTDPTPDFGPRGDQDSHDTVLLEFRAAEASAPTYRGGPPRELLRVQQPFGNHNGGQIGFNPLARPGNADFGLLLVGLADGGSGGDPQNLSQDLGSAFGKILRIDPLGSDGRSGEYGIPADNPFVAVAGALPEIWALGVRNPQRFDWDAVGGRLFFTDIGQNTVEEINIASPGDNFGWNEWEGSFRYLGREGVSLEGLRSAPEMVFPVAEYAQRDPLLGGRAASTGLVVYRDDLIPALSDRVLWGDLPSGEIFHFPADTPPGGGQEVLGRVLLDAGEGARSFLELVRDETRRQGREAASRTDLRMSRAPDGRIFLLNKHDGVVRVVAPQE